MQNGGKAIRCPPFPCLESFQSIVHTPNLHTEFLRIPFNLFLICLKPKHFCKRKGEYCYYSYRPFFTLCYHCIIVSISLLKDSKRLNFK